MANEGYKTASPNQLTSMRSTTQEDTASVLILSDRHYSPANVCFIFSKCKISGPKLHCVPWKENMSSVWQFLKNFDPGPFAAFEKDICVFGWIESPHTHHPKDNWQASGWMDG